MSVRAKLLVLILFVGVIPLAVSASSTLSLHRDALDSQVSALHDQLAAHARDVARSTFDQPLRDLGRLASQTAQWDALNDDEKTGALWLMLRQTPDLAFAAVYPAGSNVAHSKAYLAEARADLENRVLLTPAAVKKLETAGVPLAPSADAPAVGAALILDGVADPVIPVRFVARGFGTVLIGMSLGGVCRKQSETAAEGITVELLDPAGNVLCSSREGATRLAPSAAVKSGGDDGRVAYVDGSGEPMVGAAAIGTQGYISLASQPEADAFRTQRRMLELSVVWLAAGLLVAVAAGLWLARDITTPMSRLVSGAEELAQGRFETRIRLTTSDELGRMGQAFDTMAEELERRDAKIQGFNRELRQRIEQRTLELNAAHAQIVQSQRLAAMATLGAGVGRELDAPLTRLLAAAQSLGERVKSPGGTAAKLIGDLNTAAASVREITRRLDVFSSKAQGHRTEPVNLATLLNTTVRVLGEDLEHKGIEVERNFERTPVVVDGDGAQLQHALMQLLERAIQVSRRHGRITLSLERDAPNGVFIVTDDGPPLSDEALGHLFEPTVDAGGTVELGLATAYRVVEAHGGKITLFPTLGGGSAIRVALPLTGDASSAGRVA